VAHHNVTLIGDAIHTMTPGRGVGANTALRDAELLCRNLVAVRDRRLSLLDGIRDYETRMVKYGFRAVEDSLKQQSGDSILHQPVLGRVALSGMRTSMRLVQRRAALQRKFTESLYADRQFRPWRGDVMKGPFLTVDERCGPLILGCAGTAGRYSPMIRAVNTRCRSRARRCRRCTGNASAAPPAPQRSCRLAQARVDAVRPAPPGVPQHHLGRRAVGQGGGHHPWRVVGPEHHPLRLLAATSNMPLDVEQQHGLHRLVDVALELHHKAGSRRRPRARRAAAAR